MEREQIIETIRKGIHSKRRLKLKTKHGTGSEIEVELDPYMYGEELMQHVYVWGHLPYSNKQYRFRLDDILEAEITNQKFEVMSWAAYYNSLEEEYWDVVEGFHERIFVGNHLGDPIRNRK